MACRCLPLVILTVLEHGYAICLRLPSIREGWSGFGLLGNTCRGRPCFTQLLKIVEKLLLYDDAEFNIQSVIFSVTSNSGDIEMNAFIQGFITGARETPRGFFMPLIALWRLLGKMIKFAGSLISSKKM